MFKRATFQALILCMGCASYGWTLVHANGSGIHETAVSNQAVATVEEIERNDAAPLLSAALTAYAEASRSSKTVDTTGESASTDSGDSGRARTSTKSGAITEVLVTAQKTDQRLQDVPLSVTALSGDTLVESNLVRVQDYYNHVPGLSLSTGTRGELWLSIRGLISSTYASPTVGFIVDDVPFGSSTSAVAGAPDIDPNEMASVEVLRGPQGTLYGASSLGGLIKYVTLDPSTERMTGRVQGGVTSVYNADDLGYSARAAVNVPLSDAWAIRASGFSREIPGYVDDPQRGKNGVNQNRAYGGRLSALWRPSDVFSLKLGAMLQHSKFDGSSLVSLGPGATDLTRHDVLDTEGERETRVFNATMKAKLGAVDFISVSGYGFSKFVGALDFSFFNAILNPPPGLAFGVDGLLFEEFSPNTTYSQEFRFSSSGERLDWLLGAFYRKEKFSGYWDIPAIDPATNRRAGNWGHLDRASTYEEYSGFANLTLHITNRLDVQVGGRKSHDTNSNPGLQYSGGFASTLLGSDPFALPPASTSSNPTTYSVTPSIKLAQDSMLYARVATGFRPGGPNTGFAVGLGLPSTYSPDRTRNYEVGFKGAFLDSALALDASIYRIDWKDMQLQVQLAVGDYTANASEAKSEGAELTVQSRPLDGLTFGAWVSYNDAELTRDFQFPLNVSNLQGRAGERLPYSSRLSGNLSVDSTFGLTPTVTAVLGGTWVYVGDRKDAFTSLAADRLILPSYSQLDLRAGLRYENWGIDLTVNNLTDERGTLQGDTRRSPVTVLYIQPRTLGLSFSKDFD